MVNCAKAQTITRQRYGRPRHRHNTLEERVNATNLKNTKNFGDVGRVSCIVLLYYVTETMTNNAHYECDDISTLVCSIIQIEIRIVIPTSANMLTKRGVCAVSHSGNDACLGFLDHTYTERNSARKQRTTMEPTDTKQPPLQSCRFKIIVIT